MLDEGTITLIIGVLTTVFAGVSTKNLNAQQKSLNDINEQTAILEKESNITNAIIRKEKERESIMNEVHLNILDTNMYILLNSRIAEGKKLEQSIIDRTDELKSMFNNIGKEIDELTRQYHIVRELKDDIKYNEK